MAEVKDCYIRHTWNESVRDGVTVVTIPKAIAEKINLGSGDPVAIRLMGSCIIINKVEENK